MERSVAKKNQRDHVAASCGISCGETSQARPIHYRILGLILPSLSLFHLNRTDKLFLSLRRSSAASYLVSVPPVFCLTSIDEAPCWFAGDFRTQTPPVFRDLVGSLGSGAVGGSCQMVLTHLMSLFFRLTAKMTGGERLVRKWQQGANACVGGRRWRHLRRVTRHQRLSCRYRQASFHPSAVALQTSTSTVFPHVVPPSSATQHVTTPFFFFFFFCWRLPGTGIPL